MPHDDDFTYYLSDSDDEYVSDPLVYIKAGDGETYSFPASEAYKYINMSKPKPEAVAPAPPEPEQVTPQPEPLVPPTPKAVRKSKKKMTHNPNEERKSKRTDTI